MKIINNICFAVLFLLLMNAAGLTKGYAQSTMGMDFWVTFLPNYRGSGELSLIAAGPRACSGTVTNPRTNWSANFNVSVGTTTIVTIPNIQGYGEGSDCTMNTALHVVSTDTISLYASNFEVYTFDVTDVLPTESLGSEYVIQNYPPTAKGMSLIPDRESYDIESRWEDDRTEFAVVAMEDNTKVSILLTCNSAGGHNANQPFTVTLNAGQCYQIQSQTHADLNGSHISVANDKKVAVFAGNLCANIPTDNPCCCDHIVEQMMPVTSWGQHFVITGSMLRSSDMIRVTAMNDNCQIRKNGSLMTTINARQSYQFELASSSPSAYLETSEPAMVYLYFTSYDYGGSNGDPSMVIINPIEQKIKNVTFSTFNSGTSEYHYVNVVTDAKKVSGMRLDGNNIASQFQTVSGNADYAFARIQVNHGSHTLSNQSGGFVAHVYGLGEAESYSYSVGSMMKNLTSSLLVNGEMALDYPEGFAFCDAGTVSFDLNLNYTPSRAVWDFGDGQTSLGVPSSHTYATPGDYTVSCEVYKMENDVEVLVATMTTLIRVGESSQVNLKVDECDSYTWHGTTYTTSGSHQFMSQTAFGCDSLVTLDLTIFDSYSTTMDVTECDSLEWDGTTYTLSGEYTKRYESVHGCDSVVTTHLDMSYTPSFVIQGDHWPIGGTELEWTQYPYNIVLDNPRCVVDEIVWNVDCPTMSVFPNETGMSCDLRIYSFLQPMDSVPLRATVRNRCSTEEYTFWIHTTYHGVAENVLKEKEVSVFPNPTQGLLTLNLKGFEGDVVFELYDAKGMITNRWIRAFSGEESFACDVSRWREGIYTLKVMHNEDLFIKKIIIQK